MCCKVEKVPVKPSKGTCGRNSLATMKVKVKTIDFTVVVRLSEKADTKNKLKTFKVIAAQ